MLRTAFWRQSLHTDNSRTAFWCQSVVVGAYREKIPRWDILSVFPIWGFEGYAANAALSHQNYTVIISFSFFSNAASTSLLNFSRSF